MKKIVMLGTRLDSLGGISAVVNVYRKAGWLDRFSIQYIATHRDGGPFAKLMTMVGAWFHFAALLLCGRIGLLHVHTASRASFWRKSLFLVPAMLFRVPTVLHLHGAEFSTFYSKESSPLVRAAIRTIFNRVSRVVVLSVAWQEWVRSISSNPHIQVIFNPVMMPPISALVQERTHGEVLFLGRIGKRKGSYDLLDAVARQAPNYPSLQLLMGGDGELEQTRAHAELRGVGNHSKWLGWVSGADKEHLLCSASIYALPSYNEGLPMSILEAMAAGLPILSTPVGGIPEAITDGVEGYLVDPGDVETLSERLGRLLADSALANKMGNAARKKVEANFSTDALLPVVAKLYAEFGFFPGEEYLIDLQTATALRTTSPTVG